MRNILAGAGAILALAASPALAQQTESSASSQSINQTQVLVGGGAGGGKLEYSGSYSVRNVPDAMAPMISGGTNPCVVGLSAAGSVVGFGAAMGGTWNDESCERRNLAIILMNAGQSFEDPALARAGIEVLCQHDDVATALAAVGRPCLTRRAPQQAVNARPQTASASSDFDWIDNPRTGR